MTIFDKRLRKIERRRRDFPPVVEMSGAEFQDWLGGATDKELDRANRLIVAALRGCHPREVERLAGRTVAEIDELITAAEAELKQGEQKI
jgi:hypothetical protein